MDRPEQPRAPPLRVALVCPYSLSRPGGVQGQVLGLARGLGRRGHRVTVFAPVDDRGRRPDRDRAGGHRSLGVAAGQRLGRPGVGVAGRRVARRCATLRACGLDVVHVHEPFAPGLPFALLVGTGLHPWSPRSTAAGAVSSTPCWRR